jgi:hypothetical protein
MPCSDKRDLVEARSKQSFRQRVTSAYDFALAGPIAKITLATSILSLVRLCVDIWTLPQSQVLAQVLAAYRSVFHAPLDILMSLLPLHFTIPPVAKDALLLYVFFGFLYQRVVWRQIRFNYHHPWFIKHRSRDRKSVFVLQSAVLLLDAALLWPIRLPALVQNPHLVVGHGSHGPSALTFSARRPGTHEAATYFGDARFIMGIRLVGTLAGVAIVVAANYAVA